MKITIEKVIYGGQGLARIPADAGPQSGMRIFLPFTLPGETVEAVVQQEHRGYCTGEVFRVEDPSPVRVTPPCPWFGTCGGCQLQHSAYAEQVQIKQDILAETLTRAGIQFFPEILTLHAEPYAYRNRIRLHIQRTTTFAIGYRRTHSHKIVAIDHCPISLPLLQRSIASLCRLGEQGQVPGEMREIELFCNGDETQLLISAWVDSGTRRIKNYEQFFPVLQAAVPELAGAAVFPIEKSGHKDAGESFRPLQRWGQQHLTYRVAEREYRVSLGAFFQSNAKLLSEFLFAATHDLQGENAWDLYAGAGLFTLALAESFRHVTAVESNPIACGDLEVNTRDMAVRVVRSSTLNFLRNAARTIEQGSVPPDLVLLDPPRAGAGVEACNLIAQCQPGRIVYISCDPATLGRDLAALIQSGYRLLRLHMIDMFPQTGHLETIALLER